MSISYDNQLIILEKYKLTPNEYYTLMLLLNVEDSPKDLLRYLNISNEHKKIFRDNLISLQEKGIILKTYKIPKEGEKFNPLDVQINKNITKTFWKASFELGSELFETYPLFAIINGNPVSIRSISKKFKIQPVTSRFLWSA